MRLRLLVCGAMAVARLAELAYSKRNIAAAAGEGTEGEGSRATYPLMVALHTMVIAGTLVLGDRTRWRWLALLLAVQPLRAWVLATLGRSWNTRGVVSSATVVQTVGPYAYVRHPNYVVVVVELAALPLAFGARWLAMVAGLVNLALLRVRIQDEERLLDAIPEYRAHFARKARFIPGWF